MMWVLKKIWFYKLYHGFTVLLNCCVALLLMLLSYYVYLWR